MGSRVHSRACFVYCISVHSSILELVGLDGHGKVCKVHRHKCSDIRILRDQPCARRYYPYSATPMATETQHWMEKKAQCVVYVLLGNIVSA
jgi:hypothetical protein